MTVTRLSTITPRISHRRGWPGCSMPFPRHSDTVSFRNSTVAAAYFDTQPYRFVLPARAPGRYLPAASPHLASPRAKRRRARAARPRVFTHGERGGAAAELAGQTRAGVLNGGTTVQSSETSGDATGAPRGLEVEHDVLCHAFFSRFFPFLHQRRV